MKTILLYIGLAFLISGCSIFGDKIAEEVARGIDDYCDEPQQARELYRAEVNAALAADGHSILVTCAGDTVPVTQSNEGTQWTFSSESLKQSWAELPQPVRQKLSMLLAMPLSYGDGNMRWQVSSG